MSAVRPARGVGLGAVLSAAEAFLLEPAEPGGELSSCDRPSPRPAVAVFGLARRCGSTTVARALGAELAVRDCGAAVVASPLPSAGVPLASAAAGRLARALEDLPGARTRAVGRLCLVDGADALALVRAASLLAPLVLDAGSAGVGGPGAGAATQVLLVAVPSVEPSLARAVGASLARAGHEPLVVLNRARRGEGWGPHELALPESRMGAQLALGGRVPRGALGEAVAELADRCTGLR